MEEIVKLLKVVIHNQKVISKDLKTVNRRMILLEHTQKNILVQQTKLGSVVDVRLNEDVIVH